MPDYTSFIQDSPYAFLPGSSGVWGDQGTPAGGSTPGSVRPGMGLPGDRYRAAAGLMPLSPTVRPAVQTMPAIWDPNRALYVNPQSGQPFTGKLPSGQYATGGRVTGAPPVAPPAGPVNPATGERTLAPSQQYNAVSIPKQPDVSAATTDLLNTFKTTAAASLKDFSSYLNDFKKNLGTAQTAAKTAEDIQPAVQALTDQQKQYAGNLNQAQADLAAVNKTAAGAEQGAVTEARNLLPSYDAAGQAIADQQMKLAVGNLSRYKMGTGTPRSLGSDETGILATAATNAMLPLKQSEIAQRYNIINNLELPVTRDIASRGAAQAGFDVNTAQQIFSSGQATTKDIQALAQQVRSMTYDDALKFMQAAAVPPQIQQQILSGQISELAGLSGLETGSNYQGLQDLTGASLTPANYYNLGTPGFPTYSRYAPTSGTGTGLTAPNAPVEVGGTKTGTNPNTGAPATAQELAYFNQTGVWPAQDPLFSNAAYSRYAPQVVGTQPRNRSNTGPQSNSVWDPNQGAFVDKDTGAITGWGPSGQSPYYDFPGEVTRG